MVMKEKKIGKVSIWASIQYGDKNSKKIERAVKKWREDSYKKCKPILMIIKRGK